VKSDGTVVCWGYNGTGRSTVPPELAGIVTTTLTLTPSTQQYSDKVTVAAAILPATATGNVQFKKSVDGGASFADLGSPVDVVAGTASVADHQILQAAGTAVQFKAVFTATGNFTGSTSDATSLTVTKENATILYASANVAALQVGSPGGSLAANSLTLSLQVKETSPDLAAATAGLGSIANAGLSVALAPVAGGSSYASPAPPAPSAGPATPQCARSRARTRCRSP